MSKPSASPDAAAAPVAAKPVAIADAGVAVADAGVAVIDAGGSKVASNAKGGGAPSQPKKSSKGEPLNGLAAGAVCLQGAEGNGGCASGSDCTGGKCTCYNGWTSCGGACRDLSRDPYNCDKCGHECNFGQFCKWGHCE